MEATNTDTVSTAKDIEIAEQLALSKTDNSAVSSMIDKSSKIYRNKELQDSQLDFDINDPGSWPSTISDHQRCYITKMRLDKDNEQELDLSKSMREGRSLTKDWFCLLYTSRCV